MTIEVWMGQKNKTTHERRAVGQFVSAMRDKFDQSKEVYFILINYYIDGREIDLTVLKRDAIIVIELKECSEPFEASENGPWETIPNRDTIGTGSQNPYQQAKDYRFKWVDFLKEKKSGFLPPSKANSLNFAHTSAFVAISPTIHANTKNGISSRSTWFRLVALNNLPDAIAQQTSPKLNFSENELRKLVTELLKLKKADPNDLWLDTSGNNPWLEYCKVLKSNHRQWSLLPDELYISPEEMELAPAKVEPEWLKESKSLVVPIFQKNRFIAGLVNIIPASGQDFLDFVRELSSPIMLLGTPGLGKSIAMQRLTLRYAEDFINNQAGYIPIFVGLKRYDSRTRNLNFLIQLALLDSNLDLNEQVFGEALRTEKFLFVFDGLDEALHDDEIIPELGTFTRRHSHHKFVVSCRPYYSKTSFDKLESYREVTLLPPGKQETEILWNYFGEGLSFQDLPESAQQIFRIPLLLRLLSYVRVGQFYNLRTYARVIGIDGFLSWAII